MTVRNRVRWIGNEFVEFGIGCRFPAPGSRQRQLFARPKIQAAYFGASRGRPLIPTTPFIRSHLECQRLRKVAGALVLEVIREERRLHLVAEIFRRVAPERNCAKRVTGAAGPAAVTPGPDDEMVDALSV